MLMPLLIGSNSEWVELVGVEFSWLTGLSDRKKNEVVGRVWDVSQLVRSERSQHRSPVQQAICSLQETPSVHPLSLSLKAAVADVCGEDPLGEYVLAHFSLNERAIRAHIFGNLSGSTSLLEFLF